MWFIPEFSKEPEVERIPYCNIISTTEYQNTRRYCFTVFSPKLHGETYHHLNLRPITHFSLRQNVGKFYFNN
jgi:hypothetical protein